MLGSGKREGGFGIGIVWYRVLVGWGAGFGVGGFVGTFRIFCFVYFRVRGGLIGRDMV